MSIFKAGQEIQVKYIQGVGTITNPNLPENKMEVSYDGNIQIVDKDMVYVVDGFMRTIPTYYQPRLSDEEFIENGMGTFEVFRHFNNAKEDFPNHVIDVFSGNDIEDHSYLDDDDGRSNTYYVDIPNPHGSEEQEFTNVYQCFDREEAILYARLNWGADEFGQISLISG